MKTTTLIALFTFLFTLNMTAAEYTFEEEAHINDIPFNTEAIFDSIMEEQVLSAFPMEEEAYVDDIPFNTESISEQALYQIAMTKTFDFEEETSVNDIPFNTADLANLIQSYAYEIPSQYCAR